MGRTSAKVAAGHREVFRIAWVPIPLIVVYSDDRAGSMSLISVRRVTRSVILPMTVQKANPLFAALVHESESGTSFSSAALIGYFIAKDFGLPSSSIRFRRLQAISASASCDSG